jgi:hypothetical protein
VKRERTGDQTAAQQQQPRATHGRGNNDSLRAARRPPPNHADLKRLLVCSNDVPHNGVSVQHPGPLTAVAVWSAVRTRPPRGRSFQRLCLLPVGHKQHLGARAARPHVAPRKPLCHMARAGVKESQWSSPRHALTAQRPEQRSQRFCQLRRAACLPTYLHTTCASSSSPATIYGRQRSAMSPASRRRSRVPFSRRLRSRRIFHE